MFLWRDEGRQGRDDLGNNVGVHGDQNLRTIDLEGVYSNLARILSLSYSLPDIPRTYLLRVLFINESHQEKVEEHQQPMSERAL